MDPLKISCFQENDLLVIIFHDTEAYLKPLDPETYGPISEDYALFFDLPP